MMLVGNWFAWLISGELLLLWAESQWPEKKRGFDTVGVHKFTEFWILGISSWYTPSPLKSHNFTKYGRIRVLID
jgi:hypothetical protein